MRVSKEENVGININVQDQQIQSQDITTKNDAMNLVNSSNGHRLSASSLVNKNFRNSSYSISSNTNKNSTTKIPENKRNEENFRMKFMKNLEILEKDFQIFNKDDPKFQNIFKEIDVGEKENKQKFILSKYDIQNGVEIFTSDKEKLNEILFANENFDQYTEILQKDKDTQLNTHKFLNYIILALISIVFAYSIYIKNYVPISFSFFIYVFLKFEFLNQKNEKTQKNEKNSEIPKFLIKSQILINVNLFKLCQELILINDNIDEGKTLSDSENKNSNSKREYFYNINSKCLIVAEYQNEELVNLYQLESNEHMSRTKVTFFNLINKSILVEASNRQIIKTRIGITKLQFFNYFINHKLKNEKFFDDQASKEVDQVILSSLFSENPGEKTQNVQNVQILQGVQSEETNSHDLNENKIEPQISLCQNKILEPFTNMIKINDQELLKEKLFSILNSESINLGENEEYLISTLKNISKKNSNLKFKI